MFLHRKQDSYADHDINLLDLAYLANYHKIYDNFLILDFKACSKNRIMTKKKLTLSEKRELTKQKKAKSKASRASLPTRLI